MANNFIADLSGIAGSGGTYVSKNSTSRPNNTELNMEDFLTLMIVQLQNQTIDDTADTSEMLNQMVQMQMITALTNLTDASLMSYASSLVGKEVTVGVMENGALKEQVITIIGTGVSDGQQVVFGSDGNMYYLSQIMAVGRLPEIKDPEKPEGPDEGTDGPEGPDGGTDGPEGPDGGTDGPEDGADKPIEGPDQPGEGETPGDSTDKPVDGTDKPADDRPVTPDDGTVENTPEEGGENAVDSAAPAEGT